MEKLSSPDSSDRRVTVGAGEGGVGGVGGVVAVASCSRHGSGSRWAQDICHVTPSC